MVENNKRTPLFDDHVRLGAKMVPFAGWEMPIWYSSMVSEHLAVRSACGIFDVSHMGEIDVIGPEACQAINYLTCNDVSKMYDGRAQYNALMNWRGGIVDDVIVYRFSPTHYMLCVNASNTDKDFKWVTSNNKFDAKFINRSAEYGQVALQGPAALEIFKAYSGKEVAPTTKNYHFFEAELCGVRSIVARTGYTGEDGVEIFIPWSATSILWNELLECGKSRGLVPCGLGARDTLRLEAAMPLYGHELSDEHSPVESGLERIVILDKGDFLGRGVLEEHKRIGAPRKLIGFKVAGDGIVREGSSVFTLDGRVMGKVTSGTKTPFLNRSIGMAIVDAALMSRGSKFQAEVRGRMIPCHTESLPFYKRSS